MSSFVSPRRCSKGAGKPPASTIVQKAAHLNFSRDDGALQVAITLLPEISVIGTQGLAFRFSGVLMFRTRYFTHTRPVTQRTQTGELCWVKLIEL